MIHLLPIYLFVVALPPQPVTTILMDVSAYCPCELCCGRFSDGYAASGRRAVGKMIAAPKSYRFGTTMIVPGYGAARVWDRGGAIKSAGERANGKTLRHDRIDLLFPTHSAAKKWGRQLLRVEIRKVNHANN